MLSLRGGRGGITRAILVLLGWIALLSVARSQQGDTLRVLFIGNSLTNSNEMPTMFAELARAAGRKVDVDESTVGGFTLEQHANYEGTVDKILEKQWDFVVLQEQSVLPAIPYLRDNSMEPASRVLDSLANRVGARTVFFLTWARKEGGQQTYGSYSTPVFKNFFEMQDSLTVAYRHIAEELSAQLCPVGLAWRLAFQGDPSIGLWMRDYSHPTVEGSYLAACTFFSLLFGQSPEGVSSTSDIPSDRALFYQKLGHQAVLMYASDPPPFTLWPNYPNPFTSITNITFSIPVDGDVTVKIYNVVGQELTTLVAGARRAGTYDLSFDGRALSSGVYFCRLQYDGRTATDKMVVLR
jgi:hypothetical protein